MLAWIELHQSLWTHRKTFMLAAYLDINETLAGAHLARLWTWALDNAPEGVLSGLPDRVIAFGAGWTGDAAQFVSALVQSEWLDKGEDGLFIHDWHDYAGRLIEKKKANKTRMRNAREKKKVVEQADTNEGCAENVQHTKDEQSSHVQGLPNLTIPNHIITTTTEPQQPVELDEPIMSDQTFSPEQLAYKSLEEAYCSLHGIGSWNIKPTDVMAIQDSITTGVPVDFSVTIMKEMLAQKQKREGTRYKKPASFSYYLEAIKSAWETNQLSQNGGVNNAPKTFGTARSHGNHSQKGRRTSVTSEDVDNFVIA